MHTHAGPLVLSFARHAPLPSCLAAWAEHRNCFSFVFIALSGRPLTLSPCVCVLLYGSNESVCAGRPTLRFLFFCFCFGCPFMIVLSVFNFSLLFALKYFKCFFVFFLVVRFLSSLFFLFFFVRFVVVFTFYFSFPQYLFFAFRGNHYGPLFLFSSSLFFNCFFCTLPVRGAVFPAQLLHSHTHRHAHDDGPVRLARCTHEEGPRRTAR
ncbi:hypothetical protein ECC02_010160 [Trypanosoma cruzi]|uniref:Uncharacterized protein n=1 Tax=Trypanosoma cruzi TaxID=5693 RepID=A0A7J6XR80_TRYCR|nr:hypothetical protein ECC02_010160 [Trypanosoma cruzi]